MNPNDDFGTTLTALMDEVADGINPRADFDAVRDGHVALVTAGAPIAPAGGPARFRRSVGIAAAAVVLAGGGVAAYRATGHDTGSLATSSPTSPPTSPPAVTTTPAPPTTRATAAITPSPVTDTPKATLPVTRTAQVAGVDVSRGTPVVKFVGTAPAGDVVRVGTPFGSADAEVGESGEWYLLLTLAGALPGETSATVTFSGSGESVTLPFTVPAAPVTMPKASTTTVAPETTAPATTVKPVTSEPKDAPPAAVEFTVTLGWTEGDGTPLEVGLWGKAAPSSVVTATSSAGSSTAMVRADGTWEMVLRLESVAPGTKVGIRLTNSASVKVHEVTAKAPPAEVAETKPFTAQLGAADMAIEPAKQMIVGTATPGSVVRAESSYGVAEAVVGSLGGYELKLKLAGVPVGASAAIRVTNSVSTSVFEFAVVKQAPPVIEFTANAAFVECDATPPYNEYWGKAAIGATITISSPHGGAQVTANADGKWSARVEFPDAPVGQFYDVTVTSSQGGSFTFPFVRIQPA